jgi:hypothetical protein
MAGRLLWFAAIYAASVAVVGTVAWLLRLAINAG